MWRYVNNPNIISSQDQLFVECDYNNFSGLTDDIRSPFGIIRISDTLTRVKQLFNTVLTGYNFPDPLPDEFYILNVQQIVEGIWV